MHTSNKLDEHLEVLLNQRKQLGLFRELSSTTHLIDFSSNDYLGLAKNLELIAVANQEKQSGAGGSRLISGNSLLAEETESLIASFHHAEAALIFNSGYMANIGLLSSIADKHTIYIYDEYIHASIIDGMRLSFAKRVKFKHNDIADLENKLRLYIHEKVIVVVESLYSMDGDLAPLNEIVDLKQKYIFDLIVDEAHATGVYGDEGEGLVVKCGLEKNIWARIHTFGKALGLHGAAIVGSKILRNYLVNFARPFIYTTAMPPGFYIQLQKAYELISNRQLREKLFQNINDFQNQLGQQFLSDISFTPNHSPIQSVMVKGNEHAKQLSNHLREQGLYIKAILSPTVPAGAERIRICIHCDHTPEQIKSLANTLKNYQR